MSRQSCAVAVARLAVPKRHEPSSKGMKQTKPAQAMELRSLSPVLGRLGRYVIRLFGGGTPEERFWRWFQKHSARLLQFDTDQERLFDELGAALRRVEEGLTFEFGPIREGRREFVVSADGLKKHFPAVRRLVAAAPPLSDWIITPFRPPASLNMIIEYGGVTLGPEDVWFREEPDRDRVGLTLYVKGLTADNKPTLGSAGYILLDNALGEYAVETQVGFVEWRSLPQDPVAAGLRPFTQIRQPFERVQH